MSFLRAAGCGHCRMWPLQDAATAGWPLQGVATAGCDHCRRWSLQARGPYTSLAIYPEARIGGAMRGGASGTQSPTQRFGGRLGGTPPPNRPGPSSLRASPFLAVNIMRRMSKCEPRSEEGPTGARSGARQERQSPWSACNYQRRGVMAKSIKMTKCWECQSVVWEGYLDTKNPTSEVNRLLSQRGDASFVGTFSQVWSGRINARTMLPIGEYTTTRDPPQRGARRRRGGAAGRARPARHSPPPMEESMGGGGGGDW